MKITEVETFVTFEAAHRLYAVDTYTQECRKNLHGHSYGVRVVASRKSMNSAGMVVDFKLLKEVVHDVIEVPYDHSCILKADDPLAEPIKLNCEKVHIVNENPTAEWMAEIFFEMIEAALKKKDPELFLSSVSVRETEKNIATVRRTE